jgi:hypothetical protein
MQADKRFPELAVALRICRDDTERVDMMSAKGILTGNGPTLPKHRCDWVWAKRIDGCRCWMEERAALKPVTAPGISGENLRQISK